MPPRALQQFAEPMQGSLRQPCGRQRGGLTLGGSSSGGECLAAEYWTGCHGLSDVEACLFAFHFLGHEHTTEGPFGHYVAWEDLSQQTVVHALAEVVVEDRRLSGRQGQLAKEWAANARILAMKQGHA